MTEKLIPSVLRIEICARLKKGDLQPLRPDAIPVVRIDGRKCLAVVRALKLPQTVGSLAGTSFAEESVKCVRTYASSNSAVMCSPSSGIPPPRPQHHLSLPGPRMLSKTLNENSPPPNPGSSFAVKMALYPSSASGSPSSSGSVRSPPMSEVCSDAQDFLCLCQVAGADNKSHHQHTSCQY